MNAESNIGSNRFNLQCMDGSQCKATFSRAERAKFLDSKTTEKLEDLEQQSAIRLAMNDLQDYVTCPFCQYGHICPPIEEDKEFRCRYPECKEISCRSCKEKSHIPLSCEEYKKENGISERRVIEEARTEALIRTCPKCKVRILKEDGCNKVVCTTCSSAICDYCGKDISAERYDHFEGRNPFPTSITSGSKCPLYDQSNNRKEEQIQAAEREALEEIRRQNPQLSEDDLKIKFSEAVQNSRVGTGRHPHVHFVPGQLPQYGLPQRLGIPVRQPFPVQANLERIAPRAPVAHGINGVELRMAQLQRLRQRHNRQLAALAQPNQPANLEGAAPAMNRVFDHIAFQRDYDADLLAMQRVLQQGRAQPDGLAAHTRGPPAQNINQGTGIGDAPRQPPQLAPIPVQIMGPRYAPLGYQNPLPAPIRGLANPPPVIFNPLANGEVPQRAGMPEVPQGGRRQQGRPLGPGNRAPLNINAVPQEQRGPHNPQIAPDMFADQWFGNGPRKRGGGNRT